MAGQRSVEVELKRSLPRALATLTRLCASFDLAEDAAQEAAARALTAWPRDGVPDYPVAWLIRAGRNWFIDQARRAAMVERSAASLRLHLEQSATLRDVDTAAEALNCDDDLLRLIFVCAHPALPEPARVALTLKTIAGLSIGEIARAFVVTPKTMEQRLTRAKAKIAAAGIAFRLPEEADLNERLNGVLSVVYLIFNEGYSATAGDHLIRHNLCQEAIRLARLLARMFRDDPEVAALLALLLFQHSRAAARLSDDGAIVALAEQDRRRWDRGAIDEGRALLQRALRRPGAGPYRLQAAIAALHCEAATAAATDWPQIAELYRRLDRLAPNPVVTLNRAVALAEAGDPGGGLELLRSLDGDGRLARYLPFHLAHAALLEGSGDPAAARAALRRARPLATLTSQQAHIDRQLARLAEI